MHREGVADEGGPARDGVGGTGARPTTTNSTLPSEPVMGDTIAPMMVAPRSESAVQTSSSTRRHTTGSVTMPRPLATSARPASNWGFTRKA